MLLNENSLMVGYKKRKQHKDITGISFAYWRKKSLKYPYVV